MSDIVPVESKQSFLEKFEDLFESGYMPANWDAAKKAKVAELTSPARTKTAMFASIPILCRGPKCPYAEVCPLLKADVAPVGYACPIEARLVANTMAAYIDQFEIEEDNLVELSMVREIVDTEVQYMRQDKLLSMEHFIQENVVGIDADGDPVMKKELHLAIDWQEKTHKRRQALYKSFLATRESRLKAGLTQLDPATLSSTLMNAYREAAHHREEALKIKLGIIDHDDYIEISEAETDEK